MTGTIVEQLAAFTTGTEYPQLPEPVIEECKRIVLDSLGVALAARDEPKGRIGVDFGRRLGGTGEATVIGTAERLNVFGAAFANGELINALDMDAVLPPGHVTPYVLPGALATGEVGHASGRDLIVALAVSHEMSYRLGKAMDYLRDTQDGKVSPPPVYGYSSTVFGATAAIARLKGLSTGVTTEALGIAGCTAPVQSQVAWFQHAPSSTIKYLLAGALTQAALTAADLAELGHRGDALVLDDREFGFPRFIGTRRWEPGPITAELGEEWRFPAEQAFKPYPHCRILHSLIDELTLILRTHSITPDQIDAIKVQVEGFVEQPVWLNRKIEHVHDAQFSIAHGIALAAHLPTPGKEWQDPDLVFSPSVLELMDKVTHEVHPDYVQILLSNGASRPARIEVQANGQTYVGERRYPKGSPSPEPDSYLTNDELVAKFRHNAEGLLKDSALDAIVDQVLHLDAVDDIGSLLALTRPE